MELQPAFQITVYCPRNSTQKIKNSIFGVDSITIGNYKEVCWTSAPGTEQFTPLESSNPSVGIKGRKEEVASVALTVSIPEDEDLLKRIITEGILPAHPWEEPAIDIVKCLIPKY